MAWLPVPSNPFASEALPGQTVSIRRKATAGVPGLQASAVVPAAPPTPTTYVPTEAQYADNAIFAQRSGYVERNSYSSVVATTTATALDVLVRAVDTGWDTRFGISINGVTTQYVLSASGNQTIQLTGLGSGSKSIRFIDGGRSVNPNPGVDEKYGVYLQAVTALGSFAFQTPAAPAKRTVGYFDSIGNGQGATNQFAKSFVGLLKASYNPNFTVLGEGNGALLMDINNTAMSSGAAQTRENTFKAALSAAFDGTSENELIINIGHNDGSTSAAFEAAYGELLDYVRTNHPAVRILCMSPIIDSIGGETGLAPMRTAIQAVVAARPGVQYLNGYNATTAAGLDDGVHPNDQGHQDIADYLLSALTAAPADPNLVQWTRNAVNVTQTGSTLTKTGGVGTRNPDDGGLWDAGANSKTAIGDANVEVLGRVEFDGPGTNSDVFISLNDVNNGTDYNEMAAAFYLRETTAQVWESGSPVTTAANLGVGAMGAVYLKKNLGTGQLRLEFYVVGSLVHTYTYPLGYLFPANGFFADVAFAYPGDKILNVKLYAANLLTF